MHTPGPWVIETVTERAIDIGCGQEIICSLNSEYCEYSDNWRDNANLISAAPDLLEACEAALHEMKGIPSFLDSWNKLFAAVCKAKGVT